MTHKCLKDDVLKTISEKKITPKSKWEFLVKEYGLLGVALLSFVLGGLAVAFSIHIWRNSDWDIERQYGTSWFEHVRRVFPYLWALLFLFFIFLADLIFRKSKKGYKFHIYAIVGVSIGVTVGIGTLLYVAGAAERSESYMRTHVPKLERMMAPHEGIWVRPGDGRLAGVITDVVKEDHFILQDLNGDLWNVVVEVEEQIPMRLISVDHKVKLIGMKEDARFFKAVHIYPFVRHPSPKMKGEMMKRGMMHQPATR